MAAAHLAGWIYEGSDGLDRGKALIAQACFVSGDERRSRPGYPFQKSTMKQGRETQHLIHTKGGKSKCCASRQWSSGFSGNPVTHAYMLCTTPTFLWTSRPLIYVQIRKRPYLIPASSWRAHHLFIVEKHPLVLLLRLQTGLRLAYCCDVVPRMYRRALVRDECFQAVVGRKSR